MSDDELIEIRIPMIITADGKWAASGSSAGQSEPDWPWLDEMADYEKPTICPQRYWITAYVKQPKIREIAGAAVPECPQESDNAND
jgi:hypothetical protein